MPDQPLLYTPEGLKGSLKAETLIALLFRFSESDLSALRYFDFDNVPSTYLPHLIRQFALGDLADFTSLGESGIRELLKSAVELHRYRGTPWALTHILSLVGGSVRVEEWWQQTPKGTPYTFTATLWGDENVDTDIDFSDPLVIQRLNRLITAVSPASRLTELRVGYQLKPDAASRRGVVGVLGAVMAQPSVTPPRAKYEVLVRGYPGVMGVVSPIASVSVPPARFEFNPTATTGLASVTTLTPLLEV